MRVTATPLAGMLVIEPRYFGDERGFFVETYQEQRYHEAGITDRFIQDNQSRSRRHVLRGLHFQIEKPQAKLVTVLRGQVFDVGVDLRPDSPTFGQWHGVALDDLERSQLYLPPGFAHGFCVLSDWADMHYKVTAPYDPADEGGLRWDDPVVGIAWPIEGPLVAPRDAAFPSLAEVPPERLPRGVDGAR
jgi:dTDP-4-dehydrorhamnose 3,5-epimerase